MTSKIQKLKNLGITEMSQRRDRASRNLPELNQIRGVRQKNMIMGPLDPETKTGFAGEGEQQFTRKQDSEESSCTTPRVMREKNMVMSHAGPRTKNDCAGDGQQQFTRPISQTEKYGHGSHGPKTKNDYAGEGQQQITRPDWQQDSWLVA
jgi:hypothetical protein